MLRKSGWTLLIVGLILMLALTACGSSPKDQIIGKWQSSESWAGFPEGTTFEFTRDGRLIADSGEKSPTASYTWVDDNTMNWHLEFDGKTLDMKVHVEISGDTLGMTQGFMRTEVKRVK